MLSASLNKTFLSLSLPSQCSIRGRWWPSATYYWDLLQVDPLLVLVIVILLLTGDLILGVFSRHKYLGRWGNMDQWHKRSVNTLWISHRFSSVIHRGLFSRVNKNWISALLYKLIEPSFVWNEIFGSLNILESRAFSFKPTKFVYFYIFL